MEIKPRQQATTTERYHLVDALRGLCISGVVLYHLLYDINHVYGRNPQWDQQLHCRIWQEGTCFLFIAMAGFVWRLGSKSSLRRGLELNLLGFAITLVHSLGNNLVWYFELYGLRYADYRCVPSLGTKTVPELGHAGRLAPVFDLPRAG